MPIAFNHRALTDRQMTPLAENAYNAQRFFPLCLLRGSIPFTVNTCRECPDA
jgi:hypothetical protein